MTSASGIFMEPLQKEFGWGRALLSSGTTIAAAVTFLFSPLFGWFLAGGFHFTVALQVFPLKLHWNTQLGSAFNYSIFNSSAPWWLGINFAAVAVVYVLYRAATRPLPTQASEPPASDPETSSP